MKKKRIAIVLVVLAAVAGAYIYHASTGRTAGPVTTSGIIDGPEVNLAPKVQGRIAEICCREGEAINEGRTAVRLESADLEAAAAQAAAGVEKAKADIKSAEAALENARINIKGADWDVKTAEADSERFRVRMAEAKLESDRAAALYKNQYISRESLDQAIAAYDSASADHRSSASRVSAALSRKDASISQFNSASSQLNSAKAGLQAAEANLAFNKAKINDTVIASPISGVVIFRPMETGETVTPGSTILTVVDTSNLYVRTDMDETKVGPVALNSAAIIRVEGLPGKVFKGKVIEIGRYGEFATQRDVVRGRQDIKTFRVKIRPEDPDKLLKPGMTVEVEIEKKSGGVPARN